MNSQDHIQNLIDFSHQDKAECLSDRGFPGLVAEALELKLGTEVELASKCGVEAMYIKRWADGDGSPVPWVREHAWDALRELAVKRRQWLEGHEARMRQINWYGKSKEGRRDMHAKYAAPMSLPCGLLIDMADPQTFPEIVSKVFGESSIRGDLITLGLRRYRFGCGLNWNIIQHQLGVAVALAIEMACEGSFDVTPERGRELRYGLCHDLHEAVLGDWISPFKKGFMAEHAPAMLELEEKWMERFASDLGFDAHGTPRAKRIDREICAAEVAYKGTLQLQSLWEDLYPDYGENVAKHAAAVGIVARLGKHPDVLFEAYQDMYRVTFGETLSSFAWMK